MAKTTVMYRCDECGWSTHKWVGRCGECQVWGSVLEISGAHTFSDLRMNSAPAQPARPITSVQGESADWHTTRVTEFDRALGGGLVRGAAILLAGEPGIGKSTLLLDVGARCATSEQRALYVSGEESVAQVRLRADRTGALSDHLYLAAETDLSAVLRHIDEANPSLLIIDSIQTIASPTTTGPVGSTSHVRDVTSTLMRIGKERGITIILVGHVTKDGDIAGPRTLEHLVDVVLLFEGDRNSRLRMVRTVKNRYGPTDEVGCFDLSDTGISSLIDPTGFFLSSRPAQVPGTCVTVTVAGCRALLNEVQALVAPAGAGGARRATGDLENHRVAMALAVLEQHGGVELSRSDIYTTTVGGVKLSDPAADLAIILAVASAATKRPIDPDLVVIGEVGLAGEIRRVSGIQQRLAEAERLGFTKALVPPNTDPPPGQLRVYETHDVGAALSHQSAVG